MMGKMKRMMDKMDGDMKRQGQEMMGKMKGMMGKMDPEMRAQCRSMMKRCKAMMDDDSDPASAPDAAPEMTDEQPATDALQTGEDK